MLIMRQQPHCTFSSTEFSHDIRFPTESSLSFEKWCQKMPNKKSQFAYWAHMFDLQKCILMPVHSIRSGDYIKYRDSFYILAPWVFVLDHINYTQWLSVHIYH